MSPSQIKTFRECARKWGFRYVDGIKTPSTAAAELGTRVHAVLEAYLAGKDIEADEREIKLAMSAIEHLPDPSDVDPKDLERPIDFTVPVVGSRGVRFSGFVDLDHVTFSGHTVYDHKTSSNPAKWGLTEAELPHDPQAVIYAAAAMAGGSHKVDLQWTYIRTRGKLESFPVRATLTRDDIRERLPPIIETASEILEALHVVEANDLPPSPEACGNFGGCPHAGYCVRTEDQRLESIFGKEKTDMPSLQEMLAKKNGGEKPKKKPPVDMRSINAPEAPADVETKREISKGIEAVSKTGNRNEKEEKAHEVAKAGATGGDPRAKAAELEADAAASKAARKSPKKDDVLRMVVTGEQHRFAPTSKSATPDVPYCSGRTLNSLKRDGLVNFRREEDGSYNVMPTDKARAKFETEGGGSQEKSPAPTQAEVDAFKAEGKADVLNLETKAETHIDASASRAAHREQITTGSEPPADLIAYAIREAIEAVSACEKEDAIDFDTATDVTFYLRKAVSRLKA